MAESTTARATQQVDNERVRVRITMASERLSGEVVGADM